ncbi:unnamed protein product, partial [Ixodes hexagonus]
MDDDYGVGTATFRATRVGGRPLRGRSGGAQNDRNRRLNTTANVLAGLCVAPTILCLLILLLIHLESTNKPVVLSSVARKLPSRQLQMAVPASRCVLVWKGVPPVYADEYNYLAQSSKVTFFWK